MRKMKNVILLTFLLLMLAGMVYGVDPTIEWGGIRVGVTNAVRGTAVFVNITNAGNNNWNASNATFYSSTDNSTWTLLGNATDSFCQAVNSNCTDFNYTVDSTAYTDAAKYYLKIELHNRSVGQSVRALAYLGVIYVDNTKPSFTGESFTLGTNFVNKSTISSPNPTLRVYARNTTNCSVLVQNPAGTVTEVAGALSNGVCTATLTGTNYGTNYFTFVGNDYINRTEQRNFTIKIEGKLPAAPQGQVQTPQQIVVQQGQQEIQTIAGEEAGKQNKIVILVAVAAIIIVIIIAAMLLSGGKKRRRR